LFTTQEKRVRGASIEERSHTTKRPTKRDGLTKGKKMSSRRSKCQQTRRLASGANCGQTRRKVGDVNEPTTTNIARGDTSEG